MDPSQITLQLAQLMVTRTGKAVELLDALPPGTVAEGVAELVRARHGLISGRIRPHDIEQRLVQLQLPADWLARRDLVRVTAAFILRDFELAEKLLLPILERIAQYPADIIGPAAVSAGRIYAAKGDLKAALVWNYRGLGMIGDQLPTIRAGILNNIACEHCAAGSDITASELFERALEIYTREQYWPSAILVAANLADIMLDDGRPEEAVQFLLSWERNHPEMSELPESNFFYGILALATVKTGRIEEAKARIAALRSNRTDMDQRFMISLATSYIHIAEKRLEEARDELLALRAETHHERGLTAILEPLADVYAALGDFKQAYDCSFERREVLARIKKAIRDISDIEVEVRRQIRIR